MESAMRPKEVLLEYKKLIREASRDESTLIRLENNLRSVELDLSLKEIPETNNKTYFKYSSSRTI